MIGGVTIGSGGSALARHVDDVKGLNEKTSAGSSQGLMSEGIREQVAELTELAEASGHKAPLRHVHADPPPGAAWGDDEWDAYWSLYERAQGLEGCPYSEVIHGKPGEHGRPEHRHRVYLAITARGTLVRSGHDYARQEAVSRIVEHDTGAPFVKGAHNVRAAHVARRLGREDVARAMEAAGLLDGARARAGLAPVQRAQQERTKVVKADVAAKVAGAWHASDSPQAFMAALRDAGLALARGDKGGVPVILDGTGATHGLRQMLGMAARAEGSPAPKAAAIAARLDGVVLPSVQEARHAIVPHAPVPPDDGPPLPDAPAPPGDGHAAPDGMHVQQTYVPACHAGAAAAVATAQGAPGAALEDVGSGPGEPPGPGAHPDEIARYRAALAAHEDRKASAWARFTAAQKKQEALPTASNGGDHGSIQQQPAGRAAGAAIAGAIPCGLRPALPGGEAVAAAGACGHDDAGGGDGPADGPDDSGHAQAGGPGGEPAGRHGIARRGDEPGAGDGGHDGRVADRAAGGAGDPGGARAGPLRAAAAAARLTAALRGADLTGMRAARAALLDSRNPGRAVRRALDMAQASIDRRRARAPHPDPRERDPDAAARAVKASLYAPYHDAQDALRAAQGRHGRAQEARRWWNAAARREAGDAVAALASAHAGAEAARPSRDQVDAAVHVARTRALLAADAHGAWQRAEGRELDREQHLLDAITAAADARDPAMLRAILGSGMGAARRLQAERDGAMDDGDGSMDGAADVVAFRCPGSQRAGLPLPAPGRHLC